MAEQKEVRLTGQQVLQAYQIEQSKLEALQGQRQALQQLLSETIGAEQSIQEIGKAGKSQKIMVALGAGIYAEARLESTKEVKTGLGSGVLITASIEHSLRELATRKEGIQKDLGRIQKDESLVLQNINNLALAIEGARSKKPEENKK